MTAKDNLKTEAASAKQKIRDAADATAEHASEAKDESKRLAGVYAERGKDAIGSSLGDFASAVRRAGDELDERDQGLAAQLVSRAARGLEDAAHSVSGTSVDEVMGSAKEFARRNPTAFTAGAVLAGVALARFAKATSERREPVAETQPTQPQPTVRTYPERTSNVGLANPIDA